jgi:tetratricopeptide (TPR) repeat protein
MAREEQDRFRKLSAQAAQVFEQDRAPAKRIEWIYHRLCAEPETGADELENLSRTWSESVRPEDRSALAAALKDLENTKVLDAAARVEVLLYIAENRNWREETSQLEVPAREALALARSLNRLSAEARANCLLGEVFESQGRLAEAQVAFEEFLQISQRLAERDRDIVARQRDLAEAHCKLGDVLRSQDKLTQAHMAFLEFLQIVQRLTEVEPGNFGWQRDLAVAHSRVGDVLRAQGRLVEAENAFGEYLTISGRLAERDPGNGDWQREMAVAQGRVGSCLQERGKWAEAQVAFEECLRIFRRLAEQDPANLDWQRELSVAHRRMGGVLQEQGRLAEAQEAFAEYFAIRKRLAALDQLNADAQRGLALANLRLARMDYKAGHFEAALPRFEEAARIFAAVTEQAPDFTQWAKDREQVEAELIACWRKVNHTSRGVASKAKQDGPK